MIKRYLYLLPIIALGLFLSSCDNTTEPTPVTTGGIFISSTPSGAQIWVDNSNSGKVTPDSVTGLSTGTRTVTLKLANYKDTTFTMNVVANTKVSKNVTLTSDVVTVTFGPVRLWETTGTSASQPSGLTLATGSALSIATTPQKDSVDIYYSSSGFVIRTASGNVNTRDTRFLVGTSTNLNDATDSPVATGSWATQVLDTETKYFFLHDADGHYSKMIITSRGGGTPGNPAWVEVSWIYNLTADDVRF